MSLRSLMCALGGVLILLPLAAEDKKVEALRFEHEVLRENVRNRAEAQRSDLYAKYAAALERLVGDYQRKGDLDSVLTLQKEAGLAKGNSHGEEESPILEKLRQTLDLSLEKIVQSEQEEYAALDRALMAKLKPIQVELTKAGNIEEALQIKEWVGELEKSVATFVPAPSGLPSSSSTHGEDKLEIETRPVEDSPLYSDEAFTGTLELEPGKYSGFRQFEMGDHEIEDREDKTGFLTIPSGCELTNGVIYGNIAEIQVSGSYFHEMEWWQNLHSDFSAEFCLFDQCIFKKAGGWFGGVSSRWIFNNCVISGSFFPEWKKKQVGVQARETTFEGIHFPSYPYHTDAGAEATDSWWVYERCVFRNCTIPESLLIGTEDCIFENCTFVSEKLLITSRVRVKLYHRGDAPKLPEEQDKVTYELEPESRLSKKQTGSSLAYSLMGRAAVPVR